MSFSIYNQLTCPTEYTYKLVQLPKGLVEYIKKDAGKPLQFKAPTDVKNHLAICTDTTTYTVRQMNHSNTQLLVNDMAINNLDRYLEEAGPETPPRRMLAIGLASYLYELSEAHGNIETVGLPIYDGPGSDLLEATKSLDEVRDDSPIASESFLQHWHALCGSVVDGKAVLLSQKLVTEVLHTIISLMIAADLQNFDVERMAEQAAEHNKYFTEEIVETVAYKFSNVEDGVFSLDTERVAKWFGIETLRNNNGTFTEKELLLEWKSSLPPFFNASLELKLLLGHYCRPNAGQIRYLRPDSLSGDLHTRIKKMFQIVKEWDYDEFLPFVQGFVPASKKADTIILKYARKRRAGKKFVVCPR